MDFLSAILSNLNIESQIYFQEQFYKPWGMAVETGPYAQFHMVVRGQCLLSSPHLPQVQLLQAGDLVLCINGAEHRLMDEAAISCLSGMNVVETIKQGVNPFPGTELGATLICGHFKWDREVVHPFIVNLPEILILAREDYLSSPIIPQVTHLLISEQQQQQPGSQIICASLAQLLLVAIIRQYYLNHPQPRFPIIDSVIYQALNLMHERLDKSLTLDQLAKELGMSRTLFINRFKAATGQTPIHYLTNWKMTMARKILREQDLPMSKIADQLGYGSETAFQRAYRNYFNQTPGTYRKEKRLA